MPFDAQATGWSALFRQSGRLVTVPEELTRKWWDKKKQLVAKTHATGIGDKLDELAAIFKRLQWPSLGGNPTVIQNDIDNCKKAMTSGDLKSFRSKLQDIRDTAKDEAAGFRKSPLTRKTADVLEDMRQTADQLFVASNAATLSTLLGGAIAEWQKDQKAKALRSLGTTLDAIQAVIRKTPGELTAIKSLLATFQSNTADATARTALGSAIRNLCRDTTQPLGNLIKSAKAGAALTEYDETGCARLYAAMTRISNTKGDDECVAGLSGNAAAALVKLVEGWTDLFEELCGDVKVGVEVDA